MFNKMITLEKAFKKLQRAVAKNNYSSLRVTITSHGNKAEPTITWDGYVDGKNWTSEHPNLNEVIKELKKYGKSKKPKKGKNVKICQ